MPKFLVTFCPEHGDRGKIAFLPEAVQTMEDAVKHISKYEPDGREDESQLAYFSGLEISSLHQAIVYELANKRIVNVDDLRAESKARTEGRRRKKQRARDHKDLVRLTEMFRDEPWEESEEE